MVAGCMGSMIAGCTRIRTEARKSRKWTFVLSMTHIYYLSIRGECYVITFIDLISDNADCTGAGIQPVHLIEKLDGTVSRCK